MVIQFSFVLRVEGLEHTIHLTPGIGGKPEKTLFLTGFATSASIAWEGEKSKLLGRSEDRNREPLSAVP